MELLLTLLSYSTMLMFFPFFYRMFHPKVKFSTLFLSFFIVHVIGISSINIFILPVHATSTRMLLPQISIFIWLCFCFDDSIDFKLFGCLSSILIIYLIETAYMLIFYAFTGERMIEILNEPITLLFFRSSSIILYLGALEVLLYIIRKYDIRNIPYFSIVIPILTLTFLIGNCILSLALYNEIKQMMGTAVVTVLISILLLLWILKTIQIEFKKKSITIFQNEIEQQYQVLLEDYLNITDTELLQKYVRHDLLNHLQVLNEIKKEDKE